MLSPCNRWRVIPGHLLYAYVRFLYLTPMCVVAFILRLRALLCYPSSGVASLIHVFGRCVIYTRLRTQFYLYASSDVFVSCTRACAFSDVYVRHVTVTGTDAGVFGWYTCLYVPRLFLFIMLGPCFLVQSSCFTALVAFRPIYIRGLMYGVFNNCCFSGPYSHHKLIFNVL